MTIAEHTRVQRFFAVDLTQYSSYTDVRLVVERSEPTPLRIREFPYEPLALSVFVTLLLDPSEIGADHTLSLEWLGQESEVEARREELLRLPADIVASEPISVSFIVNFEGLKFNSPGAREARLGLDGEEIETLPVEVVGVPAGT